jgi:hypothetical protein
VTEPGGIEPADIEPADIEPAPADGVPAVLPDRALDTANPADVVEQATVVPDDEDDYR